MRAITHIALVCGLGAACSEDSLSGQFPAIEIVPLARGTQVALAHPPGIDLGDVGLYGVASATFKIKNASAQDLTIDGARLTTQTGGLFEVTRLPQSVKAADEALMSISFRPDTDGFTGEATFEITSDAGESGNDKRDVVVRGTGIFVGEPNLTLCYGGSCHDLPETCDTGGGGCVLPTLDFGNVPLASRVTQLVRLQNVPAVGTCAAPPGDLACSPVCVLTFDANAAGYNLGVGIIAPVNGFSVQGNVSPPLFLGTNDPACVDSVDSGEVVRRDLPLPVAFDAAAIETLDMTSTLVFESNQPGAPIVTIPVRGSARPAPVAVATIRACDDDNPLPACSNPDDIAPLERVFFDGRGSYDPTNSGITQFSWRVIDYPTGAPTSEFAWLGDGTSLASMFLPIAGPYKVRLTVTNNLGISSGVSDTSDVDFMAVPDSRVHVQLVWDNSLNDLDLHVVHASDADRLFSAKDCYWTNCRPVCPPEDVCDTVQWFVADPPFTEGNPHLDIDDEEGLGPENINISRPEPGRYRVYVHYYGLTNLSDVLTQATVRLYIDGVLRGEFRRALHRNDMWRIAEIEWKDNDSATVRAAASDSSGEIGALKPFNSANYPTGTLFDPSGGPF